MSNYLADRFIQTRLQCSQYVLIILQADIQKTETITTVSPCSVKIQPWSEPLHPHG